MHFVHVLSTFIRFVHLLIYWYSRSRRQEKYFVVEHNNIVMSELLGIICFG